LIPMTTLAAVLLVVAANMADWKSFIRLCKTAPKSDILVLVVTFLLTVFFDLVVAIEVGVVLASLLFMKRMADTASISGWKYVEEPETTPEEAEKLRGMSKAIRVFEISGPMFFAAADRILKINKKDFTKVIVVRMRAVPAIDASAIKNFHALYEDAKKEGIELVFSHVNEQPYSALQKDGFVDLVGEERFRKDINEAIDYAETLIK
ncbi:MAG: STAS domain-containing protein, partial [Lachnospiraceae bacterium]|nr:STAS domain-containing protein [Lachnospiraceae bacterium]